MAQLPNKPDTNGKTAQPSYAEELRALMLRHLTADPEQRRQRLIDTLGAAEKLFGASYAFSSVPVVTQSTENGVTTIQLTARPNINIAVDPAWQMPVDKPDEAR